MKYVFCFVLFFMLISGVAFSQENSLKTGKFGLDFTIPSSFAASVGGRFHIEDLMAIQMELGFGYQVEDENDNQVEGGGVKMGLYINKYLLDRRAAPYVKGGLSFAKNFGDLNKNNDDVYVTLAAGIGVSYFITKEFAIGGEALLAAPVSPTVKIWTTTTQLFASFYF
ncbi:MAG: porin family protein [Deltaproteobacteria bacterium]|nr:porin family protein [Deltaproteobacteria bacterium]